MSIHMIRVLALDVIDRLTAVDATGYQAAICQQDALLPELLAHHDTARTACRQALIAVQMVVGRALAEMAEEDLRGKRLSPEDLARIEPKECGHRPEEWRSCA